MEHDDKKDTFSCQKETWKKKNSDKKSHESIIIGGGMQNSY